MKEDNCQITIRLNLEPSQPDLGRERDVAGDQGDSSNYLNYIKEIYQTVLLKNSDILKVIIQTSMKTLTNVEH